MGLDDSHPSPPGQATPGAAMDDGAAGRPPLPSLISFRPDTAMPLYRQLEEQLHGLVRAGSLPPGSTLPAERQFADALGVSRATVQRAYHALRTRGVLSAQGRLGFVVQGGGGRVHTGMDRLKGFTEEMRELGRVPSADVLERRAGPDRLIASVFGMPSTARFLKLVRLRRGDGVPLSREVAWYSLDAAPALEGCDLEGSVYGALAACGVALTHCDQTVEATAPTPEECEAFGLAAPVPCLLVKRRSYASDGRMVEYVEGLFRGDMYTYRLSLKA